jgi:hypothetical protein
MRKLFRAAIAIMFLTVGLILTLITAAAVLALFLLLVGIT